MGWLGSSWWWQSVVEGWLWGKRGEYRRKVIWDGINMEGATKPYTGVATVLCLPQ